MLSFDGRGREYITEETGKGFAVQLFLNAEMACQHYLDRALKEDLPGGVCLITHR